MYKQTHFTKPAKQYDEKALRHKAIELLARREYSFYELETKLTALTENHDDVYPVLDWLIEMGLQSDARFCSMFIRSKAIAGYGPIRIAMELKQKGINPHLMENAFDELDFDWAEEVDRLILKKLKDADYQDMKVKSKIMGYLQRRGFNLDQIYQGFDRYKANLAQV